MSIEHFCSEGVEEFCATHPGATVESIVVPDAPQWAIWDKAIYAAPGLPDAERGIYESGYLSRAEAEADVPFVQARLARLGMDVQAEDFIILQHPLTGNAILDTLGVRPPAKPRTRRTRGCQECTAVVEAGEILCSACAAAWEGVGLPEEMEGPYYPEEILKPAGPSDIIRP